MLPPAPALHAAIARGTAFLLTVALAAMGLETDIRRLKARGLRPLALGAMAAVFISGLAFALVQLVAVAHQVAIAHRPALLNFGDKLFANAHRRRRFPVADRRDRGIAAGN